MQICTAVLSCVGMQPDSRAVEEAMPLAIAHQMVEGEGPTGTPTSVHAHDLCRGRFERPLDACHSSSRTSAAKASAKHSVV